MPRPFAARGIAGPAALLVGFAVVIVGAVATILVRTPLPPPPAPVVRSWDGKSTFRCGANEKIALEHVTAALPEGTAVEASSRCELELRDVDLTAPVGIDAGGRPG